MKKGSFHYGGQAVIGGVMMRGPEEIATSVRRPSGAIETHIEYTRGGHAFYDRVPVLRGMAALYESLYYGMRALLFSASSAGEEMTKREMALTGAASLLAAAGFFFLLPTMAVHWMGALSGSPALQNLAEGLLRLVLFLSYLWGISRMDDIRRVFEYHGAEHKTIFCYEKGLPLTVDNVRRQSRLHPRCGTNFLMIVMVLSIFVFAFLGWPGLLVRLASRLVLLPVIAGLAYEWLKFAADSESTLVCWMNRPGLYLELLTTREPHDDQIEVAMAALSAAAHIETAAPQEEHAASIIKEDHAYAG